MNFIHVIFFCKTHLHQMAIVLCQLIPETFHSLIASRSCTQCGTYETNI